MTGRLLGVRGGSTTAVSIQCGAAAASTTSPTHLTLASDVQYNAAVETPGSPTLFCDWARAPSPYFVMLMSTSE